MDIDRQSRGHIGNSLALAEPIWAACIALTVTFSANHSAALGSILAGAWGLGAGVIGLARRNYAPTLSGIAARQARDIALVSQWASGLAALISLGLGASALGLAVAIALWAAGQAAAAVRLGVAAQRSRRAERYLAALAAMGLGIACLIAANNPVATVGLFGAALVVVAVWQLIGQFGPKPPSEEKP